MRVVKPHFYWIALLTLLLSSTVIAQEATATPTPEPVPQVLKIWLPDVLAAPDNAEVQTLLANQTAEFAATHANITIETRLRSVGNTGGIMSTLRTGSLVAENALPTLTLLRRQDLVLAELAGLLHSMEGMIPSAVQGDLNTALQLGQVHGELYGVPYMLELQHVIYRPDSSLDYSSWSYDALLQRNQPFVFAGGRVGALSDVVLLQYLAAGGTLNREGQLELNADALRTTLNFYESASDLGMITGATMNFLSENDYLTAFVDGDYAAGVFTSTQYLVLYQDDNGLQIAPIPTASGQTTGVLNGWMWVLIAQSPEQQQLAVEYILWMLDPVRQAAVAEAVHMLPSRRSALATVLGEMDNVPYTTLLDNALLPITESEGGTLARTMQDALSSVLTLEQTAAQATEFVLSQQTE
jgi:ABC-type glycerol-3-phosphate transport system substrate-binding protein